MPFFIRGRDKKISIKKKNSRIKRSSKSAELPSKRPRYHSEDEEVTSDEDLLEDIDKPIREEQEDSDEEEETAQDKKVRLATQYLKELRSQKENEIDETELDEFLNQKLREDNLEAAGKLKRQVADSISDVDPKDCLFLRCKKHKLPLTGVVVSSDEKFIYSSSKDSAIVKWTLAGEKIAVINSRFTHKCNNKCIHHDSNILSLALSYDCKFLASGDENGVIHVWNGDSLEHLKSFKKHKSAVSGLSFRRGTHTLFSASHDRLVMLWDLDTMAFVENLGGHQDAITGIDSLSRESCITSGGRDQLVIVYAIAEDKQLRFTGKQSSVDGVKLINEKTFITFGQNGSLDLWTTIKKKPHHVISCAHGKDPSNNEHYWITSAAALVNTDLIATGSMDGHVRLWKVDFAKRTLQELISIAVPGVINCLEFTTSGSHLVAAVGREHKLGRWYNLKFAKNSLVIIPLSKVS